MKKFIILGVFAIIGWTSFYDVTTGTLTFLGDEAKPQPASNMEQGQGYKTVQIHSGDTVLSVYEKLNPNSNINIQKIISDFRSLNKGIDPNHIEMGKNYNFPIDLSN